MDSFLKMLYKISQIGSSCCLSASIEGYEIQLSFSRQFCIYLGMYFVLEPPNQLDAYLKKHTFYVKLKCW